MWNPSISQIDPITWSAGAALLCSVFTQRLSSWQSELCSELLCWLLVPVTFKLGRRADVKRFMEVLPQGVPNNAEAQPQSAVSLWIVTLGIVIACLFRAEGGIIVFLVSRPYQIATCPETLTVSSQR